MTTATARKLLSLLWIIGAGGYVIAFLFVSPEGMPPDDILGRISPAVLPYLLTIAAYFPPSKKNANLAEKVGHEMLIATLFSAAYIFALYKTTFGGPGDLAARLAVMASWSKWGSVLVVPALGYYFAKEPTTAPAAA